MTDHEHTPPIRGVEIVLNREEVRDMIGAMERAFDDDGPQIICEVIR